MQVEPGTTLAHYKIVELLGRGGMGEVWRARDTRLKREVALKILPSEMATDRARLERFQHEAETVARLSHPHIVTIHSVEEDQGVRFLTMELVEGESVDRRLTPDGLPLETVFQIGIAVADALAAAHEKHIVHRDLKPANIVMGPGGMVKVLDFGLAKLASDDAPAGDSETQIKFQTLEGSVMGTVPYMSPEQARGTAVDHRSDIFSMGIVLYELVTGRRPFTGGNTAEILAAILRNAPVPPGRLNPALPPKLEEIILKALEKDPSLRYQSAADLRGDLRRLQRDDSASAVSVANAQLVATAERTTRFSRRSWLIVAVAVAVVVAAIALVMTRGGETGASPSSPGGAAAAGTAAERSIAVLPFQNLSADADNAFFAAGVHEDVLTYLSRVADLKVISRSSVMQYAEPGVNLKQIAADLGVVYIVEGSVRRAANRVRVTAQLIDARTDEHVWAENYDRDLADVFAIQTAIAQEIVGALKANLSPREAEFLASRPTSNLEAYDLFLKARQQIQQLGLAAAGDVQIGLLEKAVRLDPQFAQAYALLATQHGHAYWFLADRTPERLALMKAAVDRAFELRPDLPEARVALAEYYYRGFYDYPRAVEQLELARKSLPNDSLVQFNLGLTYRRLGEADRSIDSFEQAIRLDPANLRAYAEAVGTANATGRVARAVAFAEEAQRRFPRDPHIAGEHAMVYLDRFGDIARARGILDAAEAGADYSYLNAQYYTSLYERSYRKAAGAAREPSYQESVARGLGTIFAAEALASGGFDDESKKLLTEAERILVAEVSKPYAETYAWPHLAYAINLALQGRAEKALASCARVVHILPFEKDKVHGATFRQECAWVKARVGKTEEALDEIAYFLEHGYHFTRWQLALDPRWDFLRDNPRFRALATPPAESRRSGQG